MGQLFEHAERQNIGAKFKRKVVIQSATESTRSLPSLPHTSIPLSGFKAAPNAELVIAWTADALSFLLKEQEGGFLCSEWRK